MTDSHWTDGFSRVEENLLAVALRSYGHQKQRAMVTEELAELIAAVNQFQRDKINIQALAEEIEDAEIMLAQLRIMHHLPATDTSAMREQKLGRLEQRLVDAGLLAEDAVETWREMWSEPA